MNKGVIAIAIICLLIGFCVGLSVGTYQALNWGVSQAIKFSSMKGIDIDIDKYEIVGMLLKYKTYIEDVKGVPFPLNASIIE